MAAAVFSRHRLSRAKHGLRWHSEAEVCSRSGSSIFPLTGLTPGSLANQDFARLGHGVWIIFVTRALRSAISVNDRGFHTPSDSARVRTSGSAGSLRVGSGRCMLV